MTKAKAIHLIQNGKLYCAQYGAVIRKENTTSDFDKISCHNCLSKAERDVKLRSARVKKVTDKCGESFTNTVDGKFHICTLQKGHADKRHRCPCGYKW